MTYTFSIGLEATKVPELLGLWLAESLPVDFTVKQCCRLRMRMRFIEVTIQGSSPEQIQAKRTAFAKVVRAGGFRGVVMKDKAVKRK